MADFDAAWAFVVANEDTTPPSGKVTTEPNGALARLGVNSHAWPEALSDGFYSLPLLEALQYAKNVFKIHYWTMIDGDRQVSQLIASKLSDIAFNAGVYESMLLIQRAANTIWPAQPLFVDGICGAWTMARINMLCCDHEEQLYDGIVAQGKTFYEALRAYHPSEFPPSLEVAWLARMDKRPPSSSRSAWNARDGT